MQVLLLFACIENGLGTGTDAGGAWAPGLGSWEGPNVNISFDIALQRNHWGEGMGRCQIQLAFVNPNDDGWGAPAGPPLAVRYPENPGECVYSNLDSTDADQPADGSSPDNHSADGDNWNLAGVFEGSDRMWLHSGYRSIALDKVDLGDELGVRYQWEGCNEEDFPFGEVFDLEAPPSEREDGIAGFYVEEAFGVGPDMELLSPKDEPGDAGMVLLEVGESLEAEWTHHGDIPTVRGQTLNRRVDVVYRNFDLEAKEPIEAVACLPDRDGFLTPEEVLAQFEANPTPDAELYSLGFQVDSIYDSPGFETPWGQAVRVRSTVTEGGNIVLYSTE